MGFIYDNSSVSIIKVVSIEADSGPLRHALWCRGSICHQVFTFIQIDSGHMYCGRTFIKWLWALLLLWIHLTGKQHIRHVHNMRLAYMAQSQWVLILWLVDLAFPCRQVHGLLCILEAHGERWPLYSQRPLNLRYHLTEVLLVFYRCVLGMLVFEDLLIIINHYLHRKWPPGFELNLKQNKKCQKKLEGCSA